ncbi:MAG: hypothetical protein PWR12_1856, partial [Eubacteriaceae bacterium]|nr:hypothetical protein [Eubacteriaceae bacterium]
FNKGIQRCCEIDNTLLYSTEFESFYRNCQQYNMGSLHKGTKAPFIMNFFPKVNSDNRNESLRNNWQELNLRSSLNRIEIVVNNPMTTCINEDLKLLGLKQISFPYFNSTDFVNVAFNDFMKFTDGLNLSGISVVSIIGDFFKLNDYYSFSEYFIKSIIEINIFYKDISDDFIFKLRALRNKNLRLVVWIDDHDFIAIKDKMILLQEFNSSVDYRFVITNEYYLKEIERFMKKNRKNFDLVPFYNNKNLSFFKKYCFTSYTDLQDIKLNDRDLFSRMYLNELNYGKLIILPTGEVHSSLFFKSFGSIYNSSLISVIRNFALDENGPWLKTRQLVLPCKDCLFYLLCNPLTSYEYSIGKMNLCHYDKTTNNWLQ